MFLLSDGGGGTVTRVDDRLGGERKDFFSDPVQEKIATSSRKIPATDAIGKKNIPSKQLSALGKVEAEAAGAVTRNVQKLGLGPGDGNRGVFLH